MATVSELTSKNIASAQANVQTWGNIINVKVYGAKGDGVTDDTTALQAALDASEGKTLYWYKNSGTHYETGALFLPSNITIVIEAGTLIKAKTGLSTSADIFNIRSKSNVAIFGNFATIEMLKAEYLTSSSRDCIQITSSSNVYIENMILKGSGQDGIYLGGSSTDTVCTNVTIKNCVIDNVGRNGISVTYAEDVLIEGCIFKNIIGFNPQAGIDLEPNTGTYVKNIKVTKCRSHDNAGDGFIISRSADKCIVSECVSESNGGSGFSIIGISTGYVTNAIITNCISINNTQLGMYTTYATDYILDNVICQNNGGIGLQTINAERVTISNNQIKDNGSRGMACSETTSMVIESNQVIDNGDGGVVLTGLNTNPLISNNYLSGNASNVSPAYSSNIHLFASVDAAVINNFVRVGANANQPTNGIYIRSSSTASFVSNNDCLDGGATYGIFIDGASGGINGGNRNKDGTYSTTAN